VCPDPGDPRVSLGRRLNDTALNAAASPVHEAHLAQAAFGRGGYVVCDDASNIPCSEGVQVDFGFDGDADGRIGHVDHVNAKCEMPNVYAKCLMENARVVAER